MQGKKELLHQGFDFSGCKIALLYDGQVLTILRDNIPTIPYPDMWELPGGGREDDESPLECIRREVMEELGFELREESLVWVKRYPGVVNLEEISVFMVGQISQKELDSISFGDEGQGYKLMSVAEFLSHKKVIPQLQKRLKDYLEVRYD